MFTGVPSKPSQRGTKDQLMPKRVRRKFGPSQKERIFFACLPDEAARARILGYAEDAKTRHAFEAALILPEHLHVTLFHLGDWAAFPEEIVRLAKEAAAQVSIAPFEAAFARAESFRNSTGVYPFVLTGDLALWRPLHDALGAALKRVGLAGATLGELMPHV